MHRSSNKRRDSNAPAKDQVILIPYGPDTDAASRYSVDWSRLWQSNRDTIITTMRKLPAIVKLFTNLTGDGLYRIRLPAGISRQVAAKLSDKITSGEIRTQTGQIRGFWKLDKISGFQSSLSALNALAVQSALAAVEERLRSIDRKVSRVLSNLETDRTGLLRGAKAQLEMALAEASPHRENHLNQAISQLWSVRGQCLDYLEVCLASPNATEGMTLIEHFFNSGEYENKIDLLSSAQRHLRLGLEATVYLSIGYAQLGESEISSMVLKRTIEELSPLVELGKAAVALLPATSGVAPEKLWTDIEEILSLNAQTALSILQDLAFIEIEVNRREILPEVEDA